MEEEDQALGKNNVFSKHANSVIFKDKQYSRSGLYTHHMMIKVLNGVKNMEKSGENNFSGEKSKQQVVLK